MYAYVRTLRCQLVEDGLFVAEGLSYRLTR